MVGWFGDVDDLLQILGQGRGCGGVCSLCVQWEREVRSLGGRALGGMLNSEWEWLMRQSRAHQVPGSTLGQRPFFVWVAG